MNRLFGKSKAPVPQPTLNDTAATLDLRVESINKQIASIDQELQAYSKLPPSRKASQKSRALALLNKKKMYERQRATIEGQSANIGATAFAVSNITTQKEIFNGLRDAKQTLAKGNRELNPDKVQDLMDDLDDQMLEQNEMNDVFSRPIGQDTSISDADLENELAGLAEEEFLGMSDDMSIHAPSVPVQPVATRDTSGGAARGNVMVDDYGLPRLPTSGMRN